MFRERLRILSACFINGSNRPVIAGAKGFISIGQQMDLNRRRKVAVLGSTGSIGRSSLDVLRCHQESFEIACISCHQQLDLFQQQCDEFHPHRAVVTGERNAAVEDWLLSRDGNSVRKSHGMDAVIEAVASPEVDIVIGAIVGVAGLYSSLAAVRAGKRLALANKESLVVAGEYLMLQAAEHSAQILPVDSEHSAIFQALQASGGSDAVENLILTASGGPLRDWPIEKLENATVEQALSHPTWSMGRKITVDSATMMNKALEVIEARWLFGIPADQIKVVIHPQSIVHSMVEFQDGSIVAQLSPPDMRLPIQYALTYPQRLPSNCHRMQWDKPQNLTWYPVDPERYPALELGFEVAKKGGTCGAVLNAANESAVELFLQGKIRLTEIAKICRSILNHHTYSENPNLEELICQDRWARDEVARWKPITC